MTAPMTAPMTAKSRFTKLLVANRGEIAVRVIRGARRLGYKTVAVYSDADAQALHVRVADEAVRIGPPAAKESYLVIEKIIAAAQASGAQAIHPGYGFLSENAEFSAAVKAAGLIFVGPDAESIRAMGSKSAAKERMIKAKVPCVPGYQGEKQDNEFLVAQCRKIGLPVMIKAAAGGGGRGMRLVHDEGRLLEDVKSARSEAANAFGNGELLIEKAVVDARHVEIQVFGDRHGNVVHFGERDCSVQRRNQKVVEEAPSPAVDEKLRKAMGDAAVAAAKAVNYVGAGTVEFLLGPDVGAAHGRDFYFLEMNTRLQVEHPVTEKVYGVDLVEWQLRVAQGEKLPLTQDEILARRKGWAIEVRLCSEDPTQNYIPQAGAVARWRAPEGDGIRVDTYLEDGMTISPYYDSMQAKVIAFGDDREMARTRLIKALDETLLLGVTTNRDYLLAVLRNESFASGEFSTAFVGKHLPPAVVGQWQPAPKQLALAVVSLYLDDARRLSSEHALAPEYTGWHSSHEAPADFRLKWREKEFDLEVMVHDGRLFTTAVGGEKLEIEVARAIDGGFSYTAGGVQGQASYARAGDTLWLAAEGQIWAFVDATYAPAQAAAAGGDGRVTANSDGKIVAVHVKAGDSVTKGQTLVVLEAMKMEFQLVAGCDGTVESVGVSPGAQVKGRQLLVQVKPA